MKWLADALAAREASGLLRTPKRVETIDAVRCRVDGADAIAFCSNDYLGLRADPRLCVDDLAERAHSGAGAGGSRLISGNVPAHEALEQSLAQWLSRESVLAFTSGYAANVGALSALLGSEDAVLSDALNHASLIDGCRLSRARIRVVRHLDLDDYRAALRECSGARRRWIVLESLFSMDGDTAPLEALIALAHEHGAELYVDEAHAVGVLGEAGVGLLRPSLANAVVSVGTMGKSLGSMGAFVSGPKDLRLYLWNMARSFVFSTGLSPLAAIAGRRAVELVSRETALREQLQQNIALLRTTLRTLGLEPTSDPRAPIVPVVLGDERTALRVSKQLLDEGVFVQAIRPPTVPRGTSRLRLTVSAAHRPEHIEQLGYALRRAL